MKNVLRRALRGAVRWGLFLFVPWLYNLALRRELQEYRRVRVLVAHKKKVLLDEPLSDIRHWAPHLTEEEETNGRRVAVLENGRLTVGVRRTRQ